MSNKMYIKSSAWNIIDKIVQLIKNLFLGILLARYLGTEEYGNYNFLISIITILVSIAKIGAENIAIKDFSNKDQKNNHLISFLIITFLGSGISIFILYIWSFYYKLSSLLMFCIILFLLFQNFEIFRYILYSKFRTKTYTIMKMVIALLTITMCLIAISLKITMEFYLISWMFSESMSLLVAFFCSLKIIYKWREKLSLKKIWGEIIHLLKVCLPLVIGSLSVTLYMKIDQIMIKSMLTSSDLGLYAAAVKIAECWYFFPTILCSSFLPVFAQKYRDNKQNFWEAYYLFFSYLTAIAIIVAGIITLFSKDIVILLFGKEYGTAASVLNIYVWVGIFVCWGCARGIYLTINELSLYSCFYSVMAAIANIVLNWNLIPKYGIWGATIATVISYIFQSFICSFVFKKTRRVGCIQAKSIICIYKIPSDLYGRLVEYLNKDINIKWKG